MEKDKRSLILKILLLPAALLLLLSIRFYADNREFSRFTEKMFRDEITGNTLNLHYTLSDPKACGIESYPVTLGSASPKALAQGVSALKHYREALASIPCKISPGRTG